MHILGHCVFLWYKRNVLQSFLDDFCFNLRQYIKMFFFLSELQMCWVIVVDLKQGKEHLLYFPEFLSGGLST